MATDLIRELFQKLVNDRCTDSELEALFKLLEHPQHEQAFRSLLEEHWDTADFSRQEIGGEKRRRMLAELTRRIGETELPATILRIEKFSPDDSEAHQQPAARGSFLRVRAWLGYAASILALSGLLYYFFIRSDNTLRRTGIETAAEIGSDVAPGGDKAILTLSDGRQIILDGAMDGVLAEEGNAEVVKLANGQIAYRAGNSSAAVPVYNTMSTPKGGQYRLSLPDGTKIWLNAASSVTYPVSFGGKERKIAIQGEVYLEVAEDRQRPFRVTVEGTEIVVLGTKFNLNAYGNEEWMKTTLLEGSVRVLRDGRAETLRPGQQCLVNETGNLKLVEHADTDEAVAWKNGFFSFHQADIHTMMRQLERWYDIEVHYEGRVPQREFEGELERGLQLSEMLKILDKLGVGFRLEERVLTVYPKPGST